MKETNMEHYRCEIEAIINSENYSDAPTVKFFKWLMSEYNPAPVLTEREKHFVEFVQNGWLARDENNAIFWHGAEPKKHEHSWGNNCLKYARVDIYDREIFPFITWEDEEPWSVEELRKLKVENE